jgi:hypothetical protein
MRTNPRRTRRISSSIVILCCFLAALLPCAAAGQEPENGEEMAAEKGWSEVERLIFEQKFEAAAKLTAELRDAAEAAGDEQARTQALIKEVQLRTGLHGYETAVRFLREQEPPESPLYRLVLDLFYARSLSTYVQAYSWEIYQRERVDSGEEIDLKAWTKDQIVEEAQKVYAGIWQARDRWGSESLGELAEYVDQNNYPARIRGTLRDAVTYLWVELLADTSLWRPEQSNEIFRLDSKALIAGTEPADDVDLADPAIHPLVKIGAVLGDLEAWHRGAGRVEAAFEARLERLRRLRGSLDQEDDRQAIRDNLQQHLDDLGRRYPWWSMGMSALAEFVRDDLQDLPGARQIALAGHEAHPDSPGALRCRHVAAAIEAPSYEILTMAADGPGRRSIQVRHKNVEALHFRAYALDLAAQVTRAEDANLLPSHREIAAILDGRRPDAAWTVELPATPDYQLHQTYVTPPMAGPGLFVVAASMREDFRDELNSRAALNFILTDLVLIERPIRDGFEVTVRSGETGDALAGVDVDLYLFDWRKGHRRVLTATTDGEGTVLFTPDEPQRNRYFLLARRSGDAALMSQVGVHYGYEEPERTAALVYTDRSVYRPQQTIYWKVVAYRGKGSDGRFETLPETSFSVELRDANYEVVATSEAKTNAFGSASGELAIPSGRLLGGWQVLASLGGSASVQVEEYKRPTFEVTIADPEGPMRLNRPAKLRGEVRYYFGLPVTSGGVAWRVTREPVFPPWWWWSPPRVGVQTVASGEARLDADGAFEIAFTPEADERLAAGDGPGGQVSYRYRLSADATDDGGETRSAQRSFRLGFVAVEAEIQRSLGFFTAGRPIELSVRRTDLDGHASPGKGRWRLVALDQPAKTLLPAEQPLPQPPGDDGYRTEGDRLRPRWETDVDPDRILRLWSDGAERQSGTVEHSDDYGFGKVVIKDLPAGAYRLHYSTTDDFGAEYETMAEFLVVGEQPASGSAAAELAANALALPAVLIAERRSSLGVGDKARFLVHSGLDDQELVFEVFHGEALVDRRRLDSGDGPQIVEVPVGKDYRGGFTVTLSGLRDHQLMTFSDNVSVPWTDKELVVEFSTFRDRLRPGTEETWTVTVRGKDEETLARGAAEVLAYMYDRSLDVFAPHFAPSALSLYPGRYGAPQYQSNLGAAYPSWRQSRLPRIPAYPQLSPDRLKFYDGYAIGGPGRRFQRGAVAKMAMSAPADAEMDEGGMMAEEIVVTSESPIADLQFTTAGQSLDAPPPPPPTPEAPAPDPLRTNFSETAFWEPHLLTGDDGSVSFEFTVPDSVTEWNVWAHAVTRDLRGGSVQRQTRTVKELLVRPYLPRFFREGDRAELKVVVNNAGEEELSGRLDFEILDPDTGESLLAEFGLDRGKASGVEFTVAPGGGTDLTFPVEAPRRVGQIAVKATATAGAWSDGELRPLPVLPGRLHLVQSRFASLHDQDRRELHFADLAADDDPTRVDEQLVVTLDAQLFYSVLDALPYLVEYPYQCTEQTLNRFLSTGIVSSLFDQYPSVATMARKLSERETRYEPWDADPNRKMALEETPWLRQSRGGTEPADRLIKVLDPEVAATTRDVALAELRKAQTSLGGFPWWPGGPPSPYMTLYILQGFSRALEFDVEVPQDMVTRAWSYMHRYYVDEIARRLVEDECCVELVTFLNYVLSSYPDVSWTGGVFSDDDRRTMLDFSFRKWRDHSPLLKGYLALTLQRSDRGDDAELVWDSVMDSARTTRDEGTFWAPEDRAWLWYNDTIETHAFALRTLAELEPKDARRHGLVQWLFLTKKLNHWKSTRATAEVIYSLAHYLETEDALAVREEATVTAGPRVETFTFEPDEYTGKKNQVVIAGDEIDPASTSTIVVEKETPGFLFASATWHFSTEELPEEARGDFFSVERSYFRRFHDGREWVLEPLAEGTRLEPGDQVEVRLSIRTKHAAEYVHLRDPRGAGFEPETTASSYKWDLGIGWYEEVRDSGTNFFFEWLPVGEYTFKYRMRANLAGAFRVGPATIQSMYAPEFAAYSSGARLEISAPSP